MILREAVKEDAIDFIEYTKIIGSETDFLSYRSEGIYLSVKEAEDLLNGYSMSPDSIFLMAFDGECIIGSGNLNRGKRNRKHRAEIGIAVRKEYWGMGIATMLLNKLIEFGKSIHIEYIDLIVRADNQRAISLYNNLGFIKICTIPSEVKIADKYYDSNLMVLDLNQCGKISYIENKMIV